MLCDTLKPCLIEGTSWKEPKMGNRVNVIPRKHEDVKFFLIDDTNNKKCPLKSDLNIDRICDLIVTLAYDNMSTKILCLVELKGHKIKDAIEQIACVYKSLITRCNRLENQDIKWMAFISVPGSVHVKIRNQELEDHINRECGIKNWNYHICCKIQKTSGKDELGSFMRAGSLCESKIKL
ncbi:MAG: hypothetical protein WCP70_02710 [Methanothrix sp.]